MFFQQILQGVEVLGAVFLFYTVIANFETRVPRFGWDVTFDKFGFTIYIPITSSLILALMVLILGKNLGMI